MSAEPLPADGADAADDAMLQDVIDLVNEEDEPVMIPGRAFWTSWFSQPWAWIFIPAHCFAVP